MKRECFFYVDGSRVAQEREEKKKKKKERDVCGALVASYQIQIYRLCFM